MGISSNDIANVMGYSVDVEPAVSDTIEAWQIGIGYHFSTNTYTTLAPWYESYQAALDEHAVSSAQLMNYRSRLWTRKVMTSRGCGSR
jgi:hypothetical protein